MDKGIAVFLGSPHPAGSVVRSNRTQRHFYQGLVICVFVLILAGVPAAATSPDSTAQLPVSANSTVAIGVYMVDFNRFDMQAGNVGADFYLTLSSDTPVTLDDFELMNGAITSVTPIIDTPHAKEYRLVAVLTTEPDLERYPFDRHTLSVKIEPKQKSEGEMALVIDPANTDLDPEADLPGWTINKTGSYSTNMTYAGEGIPYSRAVFNYTISRDVTSTILKFFLPLLLIIIVSLSSLLMKTPTRLGLNASMFLAAVLIHWRIADNTPLVTYATFLDMFMIITYATLVMVLLSGILILKYTDSGDTAMTERINYWSLRVIPVISLTMYALIFLALVW